MADGSGSLFNALPVTRRRVAVVADDEPLVARAITALLQVEGFDVVTVSNGVELVELLRERHTRGVDRPALVISDVNMPWLSGPDALLAARPLLDATTVAVMSSHVSDDLVGRVLPLGASVYAKPVSPASLHALAERARSVTAPSEP